MRPKNNPKFNNGFLWLLATIILLLVLICGLAYLNFNRDKNGAILNFEQCKNSAGSAILESYPEQCITAHGETFVNEQHKNICGKMGWASNPERCR